MYDQIFGKVTAFLSREFLARGLFPAAVLLLIGLTASLGWHEAVTDTAEALKKPLAHMDVLVEAVLVLLLTATLFEVCASGIFSFFDGSALRQRLREYLRRRSSKQRIRLDARVEEYEAHTTLLDWMCSRDLTDWPFTPPPEKPLERETALQKIQRASDLLSGLDKRNSRSVDFRGLLDTWQANILTEGLGAIRHQRFSAADARSTLMTARAWARGLRRPHNKKLAQALETVLKVEWSRTKTALDRQFPDRTQVQPTRLGNVLAALDHYGETRYGVPTSIVWSRIWWLLSDSERASVSASKLSVDAGVNLTAALLLSPFAILVLSLVMRGIGGAAGHHDPLLHGWTWAIILLAAPILARLCYLMTISLVATLADKLTALLDLRRLQCLRQLGFDPKSLQAEQCVLKELWLFLGQGSPLGETGAAVYAGIGKGESSPAAEGTNTSEKEGKDKKDHKEEEEDDDDDEDSEGAQETERAAPEDRD